MRFMIVVFLIITPGVVFAQNFSLKIITAQTNGICQLNHTYNRSFTCPHGTQKNVVCQIWTASNTGAQCRDLCPPMQCSNTE